MTRRALLACAVAATLSACGTSPEEERMDEVRRICEGLVPGTATLGAADAALRGSQLAPATVCPSPTDLMDEPDVCDYEEPACQLDFAFYQGDPSACVQTLQGLGCWYGCGLRVSEADLVANGSGAIVCARFFYGPQILPLIPR